MPPTSSFNVVIVAQKGRLQHEALVFAASFRRFNPDFPGRLLVAEPQPGGAWPGDPRIEAGPRAVLERLGATIVPFEARHFGAAYPYGNKIEALTALPAGESFVFFDTDTVILGDMTKVPFAFDRPCASSRVEGTWPVIELYGPGYAEIWKSLYDRFGLDFEASLDLSQPDEYWRRYLYFNAGWFFYSDGPAFGRRFLDYALCIRDTPPEALVCQPLDPWLDQVALPLVISSLGGGRDALSPGWLDGLMSCHYRLLPLMYAREERRVIDVVEEVTAPNWIKKVLKGWEPALRMIYQGRGQKARALFDQSNLPRKEQQIRNTLKRENLWMR